MKRVAIVFLIGAMMALPSASQAATAHGQAHLRSQWPRQVHQPKNISVGAWARYEVKNCFPQTNREIVVFFLGQQAQQAGNYGLASAKFARASSIANDAFICSTSWWPTWSMRYYNMAQTVSNLEANLLNAANAVADGHVSRKITNHEFRYWRQAHQYEALRVVIRRLTRRR